MKLRIGPVKPIKFRDDDEWYGDLYHSCQTAADYMESCEWSAGDTQRDNDRQTAANREIARRIRGMGDRIPVRGG
jgi:hypothetical protein